jgi:diguanylate cyclase (GGDEF)-like protein
MSASAGFWSTQQLTEFLAAVSSCPDEQAAIRAAVERAAEALESEVGAVVLGGRLVTSIGFPDGEAPEAELLAVAQGGRGPLDLPGVPACKTAVAVLEGNPAGQLLVARSGDGFAPEELNLLRGMGRVLTLTLRQLRMLGEERRLRAELQERQRLLEQLSTLQRAIANRAPLQEILDAVTAGAAELLGAEVVGLRLLDTDDHHYTVLVSSHGLQPELAKRLWRTPIGSGAGGRAMVEGTLVCVTDYTGAAEALEELATDQLQAAMAAPVHEDGQIVGSLMVGSYRPGRVYAEREQAALLTFADHVSLALTDAKTLDAVRQAFHDALTGLPNRALFLDRLEHALARARRGQTALAVLFVDLDRFKLINDTLGHAAGDQLLVQAGQRLRAAVREADTPARFGGDEFAILLEDNEATPDATHVAQRVIDTLSAPFDVGGREVFVSASVGIATSHAGQEGAAELLRNADVAMYRAKHHGSGGYHIFEPGMRVALMERLELEADLQRAIEQQEFTLVYQPIMSLEGPVMAGYEALIRWSHPTRGLVSPMDFIPLAEETGLILPIGRWVLHQACQQAARWQLDHPADPPRTISVNLSARQLQQASLVQEIASALAASRLDPACLVLEITESVLIQDTEATIAKLAEVKGLGVRVAIDDFGTGYSSLSYLRQLPVDILKVDKSFIDGVHESPEASAVARAIIRLGRTLGLQTVAEGIEEPAQLDALRKMHCALGQGYLFAKPMSSAELEQLLSTTQTTGRDVTTPQPNVADPHKPATPGR